MTMKTTFAALALAGASMVALAVPAEAADDPLSYIARISAEGQNGETMFMTFAYGGPLSNWYSDWPVVIGPTTFSVDWGNLSLTTGLFEFAGPVDFLADGIHEIVGGDFKVLVDQPGPGGAPYTIIASTITTGWFSITSTTDRSYYYSYATAAVPEPATWAMMIAGFGLAGAALRARRGGSVVPA